jgi:TadE-like protein
MSKCQRGASLAELLVALPVLLMLGLGALQFALWFHARTALNHAVFEAARAGAAGNAQSSAVFNGFARGITPWLYGPTDIATMEIDVIRSRAHLVIGQAAGWVRLNVISPTNESFTDWGVPARDALGQVIDGEVEIPNDNLRTLAVLADPSSGSTVKVSGMQVGSTSGQTLIDANVLRLHGHYGIPLNVPFVGRFVAATLRMIEGCEAPATQRLGALQLAAPSTSSAALWKCPFYLAVDLNGNSAPRLPVELSATVRMQSAARKTDALQARTGGTSSALASLGAGTVDAPELSPPDPVRETVARDRPEWKRELSTIPPPSATAPSNPSTPSTPPQSSPSIIVSPPPSSSGPQTPSLGGGLIGSGSEGLSCKAP